MKHCSGIASTMQSDCPTEMCTGFRTHGPYHCMMKVNTTTTSKWFEWTTLSLPAYIWMAYTATPNGSVLTHNRVSMDELRTAHYNSVSDLVTITFNR